MKARWIVRSTLYLTLLAALIVYAAYRRDLDIALSHATAASRLVETPCGRIEYADSGSGIPILIVHGAGGGFDQGMQFATVLDKKGYRVIAVSRFGYLRTPLPLDASARAQARAHACLLDALHISRAAIVGASAGAPSSMLFAVQYPHRTIALVLLVPAVYVPRQGGEPPLRTTPLTSFLFNSALRSDFLFWATTRVARDAIVRSLLATPPALVAGADREERARVSQIVESILPVSQRRLGLLNDAAVTATLERYPLERVSAPTLTISSADDLFGTYEAARYTAEQIPGARFLGFTEGGHVWVGHNDQVLAEIDTFVKSHAASQPLPVAKAADTRPP